MSSKSLLAPKSLRSLSTAKHIGSVSKKLFSVFCINGVLFFDKEAEDDITARVARLDQHFKSPMTKLVMLFLEYALKSLCKHFNPVFPCYPL